MEPSLLSRCFVGRSLWCEWPDRCTLACWLIICCSAEDSPFAAEVSEEFSGNLRGFSSCRAAFESFSAVEFWMGLVSAALVRAVSIILPTAEGAELAEPSFCSSLEATADEIAEEAAAATPLDSDSTIEDASRATFSAGLLAGKVLAAELDREPVGASKTLGGATWGESLFACSSSVTA